MKEKTGKLLAKPTKIHITKIRKERCYYNPREMKRVMKVNAQPLYPTQDLLDKMDKCLQVQKLPKATQAEKDQTIQQEETEPVNKNKDPKNRWLHW